MYYRFKQLTLLLGDLCALYIGLYVGVTLRYGTWSSKYLSPLLNHLAILFAAAVVFFFIAGLYDIGRTKNLIQLYKKILIIAVLWLAVAIAYFYSIPSTTVTPKTTLLAIAFFSFLFIMLWRTMYNRFLSSIIWKTGVVFAGLTSETLELIKKIQTTPDGTYAVLGVVLGENEQLHPDLGALPVSRTLSELRAQTGNIGIIVISQHVMSDAFSKEVYQALFDQVTILPVAAFYEEIFERIPPFTFSEEWFVTNLREQTRKMYDRFRIIIDYALAILMGVVFVITYPFIAVLIKSTSQGPIFFKQIRIGRQGKPFTIYKYRTMLALAANGSAEVAGPQFASVKDARITPVGTFLRRTRLDELPQCINILRAEMSFIGPRPERPEFVAELTQKMPFYALRHLIKPGLTGWAQLQASYYGTIEENLLKLEYDLYYVKNRGPLLDLSILLKTITVVLRFMGR